jgi:hypothetical protein
LIVRLSALLSGILSCKSKRSNVSASKRRALWNVQVNI